MTRYSLRDDLIQAAGAENIAIQVPEPARAKEIVVNLLQSYDDRILEHPINTYGGECIQYFSNNEYDTYMKEVTEDIANSIERELYLIGDTGAESGLPVVITLSSAADVY